jgi:hypothetical protein
VPTANSAVLSTYIVLYYQYKYIELTKYSYSYWLSLSTSTTTKSDFFVFWSSLLERNFTTGSTRFLSTSIYLEKVLQNIVTVLVRRVTVLVHFIVVPVIGNITRTYCVLIAYTYVVIYLYISFLCVLDTPSTSIFYFGSSH